MNKRKIVFIGWRNTFVSFLACELFKQITTQSNFRDTHNTELIISSLGIDTSESHTEHHPDAVRLLRAGGFEDSDDPVRQFDGFDDQMKSEIIEADLLIVMNKLQKKKLVSLFDGDESIESKTYKFLEVFEQSFEDLIDVHQLGGDAEEREFEYSGLWWLLRSNITLNAESVLQYPY